MRLPGGDGAGLEDQATRGSALWGDKWDLGGLPKRSKWAKSQGRGTFQPGYFTGGRVRSPLLMAQTLEEMNGDVQVLVRKGDDRQDLLEQVARALPVAGRWTGKTHGRLYPIAG